MTYGNYAPFNGYYGVNQPTGGGGQDGFIWVQGEAGAKAYLVAPGRTVILWDAESPTLYIKTAEANGMPSMRTLDFTERLINAPKKPDNAVQDFDDKFATKEDVNTLTVKIDEIAEKYEALTNRKPKTKGNDE